MENEPHDRACSTKPKRKHPRDERRDKRTIFVPLSADAVEAVRRCQRGARLFPGRLVMVRGPALSAVANGWLRSRGGEVTRRSIIGHPSTTCAPQNIVTVIPHSCFPILTHGPRLQQAEYDAIDNSFQAPCSMFTYFIWFNRLSINQSTILCHLLGSERCWNRRLRLPLQYLTPPSFRCVQQPQSWVS